MKRKRTIKVFCFTAILMCALVPSLWISMNIPDERTTAEVQEQTVLEEEVQMEKMQIVIGQKTYNVSLYENETTKSLKNLLPMTVSMEEFNGNEKYTYLSQSLPTARVYPGQIHTGDLMLYGSDCLVLFYEDFATSYGYTPLGKVDDPAGLVEAVGSGSNFSDGSGISNEYFGIERQPAETREYGLYD